MVPEGLWWEQNISQSNTQEAHGVLKNRDQLGPEAEKIKTVL